jgi:hypothetical protein
VVLLLIEGETATMLLLLLMLLAKKLLLQQIVRLLPGNRCPRWRPSLPAALPPRLCTAVVVLL